MLTTSSTQSVPSVRVIRSIRGRALLHVPRFARSARFFACVCAAVRNWTRTSATSPHAARRGETMRGIGARPIVDRRHPSAAGPAQPGDEHVVRAHIPHASTALSGRHAVIGARTAQLFSLRWTEFRAGCLAEPLLLPGKHIAQGGDLELSPLSQSNRPAHRRCSIIPWLSPVRNFFNRNACSRPQSRDATDRSADVTTPAYVCTYTYICMYIYIHMYVRVHARDYVLGVSWSCVDDWFFRRVEGHWKNAWIKWHSWFHINVSMNIEIM